MGQIKHEPTHRDLLHPRAHERDALAAEKKTVVPVREGPEDRHEGSVILVWIDYCIHTSVINNFFATCYCPFLLPFISWE